MSWRLIWLEEGRELGSEIPFCAQHLSGLDYLASVDLSGLPPSSPAWHGLAHQQPSHLSFLFSCSCDLLQGHIWLGWVLGFISVSTSRYININCSFTALATPPLAEKNINSTSDEFLVHAYKSRLWTQPWIIIVCLQMISWEDGEGPRHCCQQYVDELQCLAVMLPPSL